MKKFFVNLVCSFIPSKTHRDYLRQKMMYNPINNIQEQIDNIKKELNNAITKIDDAATKTEVSKIEKSLWQSITPPLPPTDYSFNGQNNKLLVWDKEKSEYIETTKIIPGLFLNIEGNNNTIKIKAPEIIERLELTMLGDNHKFSLGDFTNKIYDKKITYLIIFMTCGDCELTIGDNLVVNPMVIINMCERGVKCFIGDNVRLAAESKIYVSDAHPIIDIEKNKIINYGDCKRVLKIGNNCWIGTGCFIGKSANLPDYTIVAAQSNVVKPFDESYTVIGGNPAHVLKRGVKRIDTWEEAFEITNSKIKG